jgi:hypothetical protein
VQWEGGMQYPQVLSFLTGSSKILSSSNIL